MYKNISYILLIFLLMVSCKKQNETTSHNTQKTKADTITLKYAQGFKIIKHQKFTEIIVSSAWPGADKHYTYVVGASTQDIPKQLKYDAFITRNVTKIVATTTAHIPQLESLDLEEKLIAFPTTNFISSPKTRALIDAGKVQDLGRDVSVNLERLIALKPDLYIAFTVDGPTKSMEKITQFGIPVVFNGGWAEKHPLGKTEWIKFIGALTQTEDKANKVFNTIEQNYLEAKKIAASAAKQPTVLCGSTFKEIWAVPNGESWAAKLLADANANYLWKETKGTGSNKLNVETVLEKARHADFWITPFGATSKEELLMNNVHYQHLDAFKKNNVYLANKKGPTGGLIFYELSPSKPDIILKDLIKILHPELLPEHELYFYSQIH